jgi:hypothetical protein
MKENILLAKCEACIIILLFINLHRFSVFLADSKVICLLFLGVTMVVEKRRGEI